MAESLPVHDTREEILALQQETTEGKNFLKENPPIFPIDDVAGTIGYAEKGGNLSSLQLCAVAYFINAVEELILFFKKSEAESLVLKQRSENLHSFQPLYLEITRCIDENGEVLNTASMKLASLRKKILQLQLKIQDVLETIIHSPQTRKYLQDPIITTRSDRYVVPVKSEDRNYLKGIVHDRSASGATLFIEPLKVVELNNELNGLKKEEEIEIERVLADLTERVRKSAHALGENYTNYCYLDAVFSRAKLSAEMDGIEPHISHDVKTLILKGRHPLIGKEAVVPVDINIGEGFKTLLVTGPNTGGKTVILKTVGLFALMAQAGLHVPAEHGTKLAVYDQIFADIGDEQSIEQSLSTFSGHIANIINILAYATGRSLVLLDELGAGTDPAEGVALAKGILLYFYDLGATAIATTHYSELKLFANSHEGMENASVEFDVRTLSPTYKLLMGIPGKSNALAIAERLGMPDNIIAKARELQSKSDVRIDDLVEDLVKKKKEVVEYHESIRIIKADTENYLARAKSSQADAEKRRKEILQKAREEALFVVTRAKQHADTFYRELKRLREEQDVLGSLEQVQEFRQDFRNEQSGLLKDKFRDNFDGEVVTEEILQPGMKLGIKSLDQRGILIDYNSMSKEAQLQVGVIKIKTSLDDLFLPQNEPAAQKTVTRPYIKLQTEKSRTIPLEIDLRGLTLAETIDRVEKYLDDCLLAGMDRVSLIHGKGTGKLRRGLHAYLETVKAVKDFRLGEEGEGDSGVTIVYLNK